MISNFTYCCHTFIIDKHYNVLRNRKSEEPLKNKRSLNFYMCEFD